MSEAANHSAQRLNLRMSGRTRIFVLIMTVFGAVQLLTGVVNWQWSHPKLFLLYLAVAAICSYFQVRSSRSGLAISVSLPVILLSILQLNLPEAVAVGCAAALAQNFWDPSSRLRLSQIVLSATTLATVIATANFAYQSLVPNWLHNDALRLFVASVALFFANTFPAAIAARLNQSERLGQVWKESYFWLFPYYLVAAAIANVLNAASTGISFETALIVLPVLYVAYRYYSVQKSLLEEQKKHAGNLAALHLRAIESLALAVEAKDNLNTRGHLRRVQVYALGVGKDLGLSAEELDALHAGALLHDIGKLAVPEHILTKPGKLTPEEFAKMKVHPLVGAEIVEQVQFPYPVAPIVRAHHEKWDGSGYPFGLKGEDIPLGARILTAVDCLDALTSNREYRQALPLDEGMEQIANEAGKSFDPKVVEVLKRRYQELDQLVRANPEGHTVLSRNIKVDNGKAPDAGLDLCALSGLGHGNKSPDFLSTISSAGREGKLLLELAQGVVSSLDLNEMFERLEESLRPMLSFRRHGGLHTAGQCLGGTTCRGRQQKHAQFFGDFDGRRFDWLGRSKPATCCEREPHGRPRIPLRRGQGAEGSGRLATRGNQRCARRNGSVPPHQGCFHARSPADPYGCCTKDRRGARKRAQVSRNGRAGSLRLSYPSARCALDDEVARSGVGAGQAFRAEPGPRGY